MNKQIKNIDRDETLWVAELDGMLSWIPASNSYQNKLNNEGTVLESSLIIGIDTDTVVKITRQFPLDFYINNKGRLVETDPPVVDPFKIEVYYPGDGLKTIYKVIEVEKDVSYNDNEIEDGLCQYEEK